MITGIVTKTETHPTYGFTTYWINDTRFSADGKGQPKAQVGETVSFETFDKQGKDGRSWPTIKLATFKKVAAQAANPVGTASVPGRGGSTAYSGGAASGRESYWTDKAASDAAKDPRISLQGAYKVAVEFLPVVLAQGALPSFDKAKATAKLEILRSFLDEEANRIHTQSYAAKVPDKAKLVESAPADKSEPVTGDEKELDNPEVWS